jgi:DNA-binding NtrC family response regulator
MHDHSNRQSLHGLEPIHPNLTSTSPRPGATILVAENDPGLLKALEMCLSFAGHRVLSSSSGDGAWREWNSRGQIVDVLLTDAHFPVGLSGTDLAARAQRDEPSLKVIYLTGTRVDLFGANRLTDNCLPMPFLPSALRALLNRLLSEG